MRSGVARLLKVGVDKDADAEGVEGGREWGGGFPLPSRLEGLGERRKLG